MSALAPLTRIAEELLVVVRDHPLKTGADAALLNEVFVGAYAEANRLEKERKAKTKPIKAQAKEIEDEYRTAIDAYRAVENAVRTRVELAALEAITRQTGAREALLKAAVTGGDTEAALAVVQETRDLQPLPGALSVSFDWRFQITDLADVPREFLCVDAVKVNEYLSAYKKSEHVPSIPGLSFIREAATRKK